MNNSNKKLQEVCTINSRKEIGFPNDPTEWRDSPAHFSADGSTLNILGHPVMESWEEPYMEKLAKIATSNGGKILELGFGLGISASYIQKNEISEHVIIEANREVSVKAQDFANNSRFPTRVLEGLWQDVIHDIPSGYFNGILFDTYPLDIHEVHCQHFSFFEHAFRVLSTGGVFTYYSDEIIDFSPKHIAALNKAGFTEIKSEICSVNPPDDCLYWTSKSILAPIITKL